MTSATFVGRVAALCVALLPSVTLSDESSHEYKVGEAVLVWVNKVGPFHNPSETYPYYESHVPFCNRATHLEISHNELHYAKFDGLGSILQGNDLRHSGIPMKFRGNQTKSKDCVMVLKGRKHKRLMQAIKEKYWYQMYIDDLPIWGMVGEFLPLSKEPASHAHNNLDELLHEHFAFDVNRGEHVKVYPHVFSHKAFSISHNGPRIIQVNLTSEAPVLLERLGKGEEPQKIVMTYSIRWIATKQSFNSRFDRYLDFEFFEHQIHWFALANSFMLVIFLVGMVSMVLLRTLKKDYERIALEDTSALADGDDLGYDQIVDETGWKKLHGDVFREPNYLAVFSAVIGTGYQLYTSCLLVILLAISGRLYDTRGTIATASVLTYAVTSLVAGYTSAQTFLDYSTAESTTGGQVTSTSDWKVAMILTGLLLPSVAFAVCFFLNILSVTYNATNAISFLTFLTMLFIWMLSLVLLFVGTLVGRSSFKGAGFPCKVNTNFVRPIPSERPWYMNLLAFCSSVGVLPFGSIFIEMYYIFNSFWNYKFYYVYGFMLIVYFILTVVTACVTVVATYLLLNWEDRRWKWVSIFSGGSTAMYVFLYATFYYYTKTQMAGLFQTAFYFGYMFLFSLAIFFICGTIGYIASSVFVRRIYEGIKID